MKTKNKNIWCPDDDKLSERINHNFGLALNESTCVDAIPRMLHFIWLGSPLSEIHEAIISTWRTQHPAWQINIWRDIDVVDILETSPTSSTDVLQHYRNAPNFGMKSDILRYFVLLKHGGIYVDVDYECLRPFDDFFFSSQLCSFFAGISNTSVFEINNGIIGCSSGHPLMRLIVDRMISNLDSVSAATTAPASAFSSSFACISQFLDAQDNRNVLNAMVQPMETIRLTGPGHLTRCIYDFYFDDDINNNSEDMSTARNSVVVLPIQWLHPVPNTVVVDLVAGIDQDAINELKAAFVTDESLCVHWWQRSWQQQSKVK